MRTAVSPWPNSRCPADRNDHHLQRHLRDHQRAGAGQGGRHTPAGQDGSRWHDRVLRRQDRRGRGSVLVQVAVVLTAGILIIGGSTLDGPEAWATFVWVVLLSLLATLPLGAILGAVLDGPRATFLLTMPLMGLIAISGIFYPITALPGWLQGIGQAFPILLERARHALGSASRRRGRRGDRPVLATSRDGGGTGGLGGRRATGRPGSVAAHGASRIGIEHGCTAGEGDAACLLRSSTTASRCCAPSGESRGESWPRRWESTTRPWAISSAANTAPACIWHYGSPRTSRWRWRWCSPRSPSPAGIGRGDRVEPHECR